MFRADEAVIVRPIAKAGTMLLADPVAIECLEARERREVEQHHDEQHLGMREFAGRCLVCSDGISLWASQSPNALQKSSRQQYRAVVSTVIEEAPGA